MSSSASNITHNSQFIRAGAGAGKTTRLISHFIRFAEAFKLENDRFPKIIMTTFTKKATQEVKERLLVSAIHNKELFEYINQKSSVQISTIHGVLSLFLSQNADRLKFPNEIKIVDGPQYTRLLKRQISLLLKQKTQYLDLLETYSFSDLTQLAKTAMELKSQYDGWRPVSKDELTLVANAQRSRILKSLSEILLLAPNPPEKWKAYFSALKNLEIAIKENRFVEATDILADMPRKPAFSDKKTPDFDPRANEIIEELRSSGFDDLYDSSEFITEHQNLNQLFNLFLEDLYEINMAHKRKSGEMTMADLENISLLIMRKHPEAAQEFSDAWDYFMIDEYQDTSPLQVTLLEKIIGPKPCFIVGDPQQSIYLFRGARSEVFAQKESKMKEQGVDPDFLNVNYRTEPALMTFINEFFQKFSSQFSPMICREKRVESKALKDVYYIDAKNQAEGAIEQIKLLIKAGVSPQDICVLSRSNRSLEELAALAGDSGIPVQLQAAAGFDSRREILDLMLFCRFLVNPYDDENLVGLLRSPWFFIPDRNILEVRTAHPRTPIWTTLQKLGGNPVELLKKYLNCFDSMGIVQTLKLFMTDSGLLFCAEYYDSSGKFEANVFKFLDSLTECSSQPGFSLGLFLDEQFLSVSLDFKGNSEAQPILQPDSVSLMTIHASKGLQFKHVIIVGFVEKLLNPNVQRLIYDSETGVYSLAIFASSEEKVVNSNWTKKFIEQQRKRLLDETDRLLYVAMTRAIESLSLVRALGKRAVNPSWNMKMEWPKPGAIEHKAYSGESLVVNELTEPMTSLEKTSLLARPPYSASSNISQVIQSSVTDLLSKQSNSNAKSGGMVQIKNLEKAQFGTDLHRIFESLKYLSPEELKQKLTADEANAVDFLFSLKELNVSELMKRGANEWGFGLKTATGLMQGQIDLWAELDDAIHVVDYKTGSSQFREKALKQLEVYTVALLKMGQISKNKPIIHSVIYPIEKTLVQQNYKNHEDFLSKIPKELEFISA